jgi:hypothetical protein
MTETVLDLQRWLNSKGARLTLDGRPGPATRAAVIEVFRNREAPAVTAGQMVDFATRLGCTVRQLRAVAAVESGGGGWDRSGLLACLWERHWLWRRVKLAVPMLSDPRPGGYTVDADGDGINDSWEKLADAAMRFGFGLAAECASFGKFQVMGGHWQALGYASIAELVWSLSRHEAAHYELLCRFIEHNGLKGALQRVSGHPPDCLPFARGYNGRGQKGYDARIAKAFRGMA